MKYIANIFPNGRFALIPENDFDTAVEQGKEILIFCGGWAGGYAKAVGADREEYDGNECWMLYSYDIQEDTFDAEALAKFHKVIITHGIRVYMKTGEQATRFQFNKFVDWDTSYADYYRNCYDEHRMSPEEFAMARYEIDIDRTLRMIKGNEAEDIREAIKGYLH